MLTAQQTDDIAWTISVDNYLHHTLTPNVFQVIWVLQNYGYPADAAFLSALYWEDVNCYRIERSFGRDNFWFWMGGHVEGLFE
jgi:hypothetical protein